MYRGALLYQWLIQRIRVIAARIGLYGSMCALCITLLGVAILLVVSLIPLYLNQHGEEALGEFYCINNHTLAVGFQIPQYNTTFNVTMTSLFYTARGGRMQFTPNITACLGPVNISTQETLSTTDACYFQLFSIISPKVPNAKVYDNYALDEACYRTLQSCYYDPLLTSCLLSNCTVIDLFPTSATASTPLTNYTFRCTTNVYYKTRCLDDGASNRLYYSSSQRNSACRQQRLNRINQCLNSTVQLLNVPCLISVSSGTVKTTTSTCTQTLTTTDLSITISDNMNTTSTTFDPSNPQGTLTVTFTTTGFSASDQDDGHVYRISSVNSQNYASNQLGALYCGAVTHTQIASSINTAISSQT